MRGENPHIMHYNGCLLLSGIFMQDLSTDMQDLVLSFLNNHELAIASSVCKQWKELCDKKATRRTEDLLQKIENLATRETLNLLTEALNNTPSIANKKRIITKVLEVLNKADANAYENNCGLSANELNKEAEEYNAAQASAQKQGDLTEKKRIVTTRFNTLETRKAQYEIYLAEQKIFWEQQAEKYSVSTSRNTYSVTSIPHTQLAPW